MYNEQEEILREQIYDVIRYECEIDKKDSLPDILLNYGQYAIRGEYADNLTYQYIPQTLSIAQSSVFATQEGQSPLLLIYSNEQKIPDHLLPPNNIQI